MATEKLYDVFIVEKATAKIESCVGERMRLGEGHYNALRRQQTVQGRINDRFCVRIHAAGEFRVGDICPATASKLSKQLDCKEDHG